MPYSEETFARMNWDPVLARRYFWRAAMQLQLTREEFSKRAGAELLAHIDLAVRSSIERPPVCPACKQG